MNSAERIAQQAREACEQELRSLRSTHASVAEVVHDRVLQDVEDLLRRRLENRWHGPLPETHDVC